MQTPCISQFFNNISQVGASFSILRPALAHGTTWLMPAQRPFIPLYGVHEAAAGNFVPLTMASNQNNRATFLELGRSCYLASVNATNPPGTGLDFVYESPQAGNFDQYLYKRLSQDANALARYMTAFDHVYNFWTMIDLANTQQQYFAALTFLGNKIQNEIDKQLYVPPGIYEFSGASTARVALAAWLAADTDFDGIAGIELSIG